MDFVKGLKVAICLSFLCIVFAAVSVVGFVASHFVGASYASLFGQAVVASLILLLVCSVGLYFAARLSHLSNPS